MSIIKDEDNQAPEGGWGYVVFLSHGVLLILNFGFLTSQGILFNDHLTLLTGSSVGSFKLITTANSYMFIFSGVGSFALNLLLKFFTPRIACLIGAMLILSGDIVLLIISSPIHFLIAQSLLKGLGFGILSPASIIVITAYFVRHRTSMVSLAETFPCISGIILPPVIVFLKNYYGFQGTVLIVSGLNLHSVCAALTMIKNEGKIKNKKEVEPFMNSDIVHNGENKCYFGIEDIANRPPLYKIILGKVVTSLDLSLLKDPVFTNSIIGVAFTMFTEMIFVSTIPLILMSMFTETETAYICSIGSGAEIVAKIVIAFVNYFSPIQNRRTFFIATIMTALSRIVMMQKTEMTHVLVCYVFICVFRSLSQVTFNLVISDLVPKARLPAALSLFYAVWLILFAVGNHIIGLVRENTEGFLIIIHTINISNAVCVILWTVEYCIRNRIFSRAYTYLRKLC